MIEIRLEAVLFNKEGKLLLIQHEKNQKKYWVLPGGHLEPFEKFEVGLKRELKEELSIHEVIVNEIAFVSEYIDEKRHIVKIGFNCKSEEKSFSKICIPSKEEKIKNFNFFSIEEISLSEEIFYPDKNFFIELIKKYSH